MESKKEQYSIASVVEMFQGYNSFTGKAAFKAVKGDFLQGDTNSKIKSVIVTDSSTMSKTLEISVSAGVSFMGTSVNDKADFMDSLSLTTNSVSIVAYGSRITEHLVADEAEFIAKSPPSIDDLLLFYKKHGDSFISEIVKGIEYIGVFTFYCQTKTHKESLSNTLTANGIVDGVKWDASLAMKLSSISEQTKTRQKWSQQMFGLNNVPYPEMQDVTKWLSETFPTLISDNATTVRYSATGYEVLSNVFDTIATTRQIFDSGVSKSPTVSTRCTAMSELTAQAQFVKDVYGYYALKPDFDKVFNTNFEAIEADTGTLHGLIEQIRLNPTVSYTVPSLPSLGLGLPVLNFAIETPVRAGGGGGGPYQDVTYLSVLSLTRIVSITMRGGNWVDRLDVSYRAKTGEEKVDMHGGGGGGQSNPLNLQEDEYIKSVSGVSGNLINQIRWETSKGQRLIFPPHPDGAGAFGPWTADDHQRLLGFQGRSGIYLDQLELVVCSFQFAIWG